MSNLAVMGRVAEAPEVRIWTPEGDIPADVVRVKAAIEQYDPNLTLGRHILTGDWVIWLKQGPDKPPRPVIALAQRGQPLPDAETVTARLRAADTRIHGDAILTRMRAENDALRQKESYEAEEATGTLAEALTWAHTDIKGYSGRTANVKGRKRDSKRKD